MNVSLQDVHEALGELGKFRFGEIRAGDAAQTPAVIRQSRFSPPCFSSISEGRRPLAAIGRDCTKLPKVTQEFK